MIGTVSGTGFLGDGPEGPSDHFAWVYPSGIAVDPDDPEVLHVATESSRVNRIDLAEASAAFEYGTGSSGYSGDGGPATEADFRYPSSVAFDSQGNLYIGDMGNQVIRRVTPAGIVERVAGTPLECGYGGDGGPALDAKLCWMLLPSSMFAIADDVLYVADTDNHVVRSIDLQTMVIDLVAGVPWGAHDLPFPTEGPLGDGGPALDAYLKQPRDVAAGVEGELYIADTGHHCVRVLDPDGNIRTFAGTCGTEPDPYNFVGDGEPARSAMLNEPRGVATDPSGNVYIADTGNQVIRRVAFQSFAHRLLADPP